MYKTRLVVGMFAVGCVVLAMGSVALGVDDKKPKATPVGAVVSVNFAIQESNPPTLVVTAIGQVSSGGYGNPKLIRVTYVTPPADGIQDYHMIATPPDGPAIQVISQVTAVDRWPSYTKEAPWLKGIRVHGANGSKFKMLNAGS